MTHTAKGDHQDSPTKGRSPRLTHQKKITMQTAVRLDSPTQGRSPRLIRQREIPKQAAVHVSHSKGRSPRLTQQREITKTHPPKGDHQTGNSTTRLTKQGQKPHVLLQQVVAELGKCVVGVQQRVDIHPKGSPSYGVHSKTAAHSASSTTVNRSN